MEVNFSFCAGWYLMIHGPILVYGPRLGTDVLENAKKNKQAHCFKLKRPEFS